ncbi:hypothetical protein [Granulicella mallensis]|uniref:Uncharacterized protein n=1 Tax=Granulicella mallensis TaxID=940614 RepID=A0A7W7ZWM1_9BACT|nr:hypothetical protein [Granulicella mallensis]MBB5066641.1 hypothetical protein [Granulicella mallensis]
MFSKDRVVIPSNTARFAKRLAQPFTKQNLLCAVRAIAPALFALTLSSAAHAQGTMDFSGAQTLMGTFNSLTAYTVSANHTALLIASFWWPIGFALAAAYFIFISRHYAGKVNANRDNQGFY